MIKLSELTLREKICQTVIINKPEEIFEKYGGYKEFFKKYPVGGIYTGGSIVGGCMPGTNEVFEIFDEWNKETKVPIIFCCDFETGKNEPHQMAIGATKNREIAYESGKQRARIVKNRGEHWMFNPVADLAMSYTAPINIRALGDNPEEAGDMLVEMIKGANSERVISTAKHFPGMGRELMDTHLTRVNIDLTKEEWDKTYRVIYKKMIDNGLMSVMSAHMSLPCYQQERDENGFAPIATVSKELITGLLKEDLGFKGVVVTDGLIMGGTGGNSAELAIKAFEAGNDMLLWPDMSYVDVLEEKINNGEIPMSRLDDAVEKIFKMKEFAEVGKWQKEQKPVTDISSVIAENSLTLLNNRKGIIPFNKEEIKKVVIIVTAKDKQSFEKLTYLKEVFEKRGIEVRLEGDLWIPKLKELEKEADLVLFALFEGPSGTPGPILINGENATSVWASQNADPDKAVIVSFGSPFLYSEYYKHITTYINAYSNAKTTCEAVVKALFGEIEFKGKSPVKL